MWRSFFCALVAGIILRIVNPFGSDQTSLFHVDYMMKWTFVELIPFAGLGLFGGILGSLFIFGNIRWSRFRKTSKTLGGNPIYEVIVVTFLTAAISYFNPYMRKSASSMIKQVRKVFTLAKLNYQKYVLLDAVYRVFSTVFIQCTRLSFVLCVSSMLDGHPEGNLTEAD
ncbi:hypothetical protein COOONC_04701 [Cooperia oncophora]